MKISWGWKIAGLYTGFVVLISVLVYKSMHQHFDLTAKDYYAEEIKYQEVIDAGKNQSTLTAPVAVHTEGTQVVFSFPEELKSSNINGSVHFYSPVQASWDAQFNMNTGNGIFSVPVAQLRKTRYQLKISWEANGKHYYQESDINLSRS